MVLNRILYAIVFISSLTALLLKPQPAMLLLFVAVVLMPIISLVICLSHRRRMLFGFKMPSTVEKSAPCSIKLGIKNNLLLPMPKLSATISLLNLTTGYKTKARINCYADAKNNDRLVIPFKSKYCGLVVCDIEELDMYDYFGIFKIAVKNSFSGKVTVLPEFRRELSVAENAAVKTLVDSIEYSLTKKGFDNSEVFSIEEYKEGDSIRTVHWKLSSKSDTLYVKQFSEPVNSFVCLVLESLSSVGKTKFGSEVTDGLMESFFSFSHVLLEEGISHTISWFEPQSGTLSEREILSIDDLLLAINDVLSSPPHSELPSALQCRRESLNENTAGHTVYFTPYVFSKELSSFATLGALTVINCGAPVNKTDEQPGFDVIELYSEDAQEDVAEEAGGETHEEE